MLLLVVLAVVQGVTEFLPISSSAHLVLTRAAWSGLELAAPAPDPVGDLAFDVALHMGTLLAVACYFWRDVRRLILGGVDLARGGGTADARLAWLTLIATLPAIVAGFLLKDLVANSLRGLEIIAWTTLIFGIALGLADRRPADREAAELSWQGALLIGVAQAFALVPGVSRSGIAMTAARCMRVNRAEAARFALLLALPTIAGAGLLAGVDLWQAEGARLGADAAIGAGLSFLTAYGAIWAMMRWLKTASFLPFVAYRVILGLGLLWLAYS